MTWLEHLPSHRRRGSSPRCLALLDGDRLDVAARLSALVHTSFAQVTIDDDDRWAPRGPPVQRPDGAWSLGPTSEAMLPLAEDLLPVAVCKELERWWLAVPQGARTPNWDVASTCAVDGRPGLLLIEAKAHRQELVFEEGGKRIVAPVTANSRRNHSRIAHCIEEANIALGAETGVPWALSTQWNYQMSNRFAWAWKLTELGVPVVLVYLGFLNAGEMADRGALFRDHHEWEAAVRAHSQPLLAPNIWDSRWVVHGQPLLPLIRSVEQPMPE